MTPDPQLSLFSQTEWRSLNRSDFKSQQMRYDMDASALKEWKNRVFQFQQQVQTQQLSTQPTLFNLAPETLDLTPETLDPEMNTQEGKVQDVDILDPFRLPQQNTEFWRWRGQDAGTAALYFVIDFSLPLLLYVGETVKSGQRWQGEHDCKRYLLNYRQAHFLNQLDTVLGITFWAEAPVETHPRQQLESALIRKWRSPFNKENWTIWATPFIGTK